MDRRSTEAEGRTGAESRPAKSQETTSDAFRRDQGRVSRLETPPAPSRGFEKRTGAFVPGQRPSFLFYGRPVGPSQPLENIRKDRSYSVACRRMPSHHLRLQSRRDWRRTKTRGWIPEETRRNPNSKLIPPHM
eukprot:scaffold1401_cov330-Pavlova_lutheri.AAC.152